MKLTENLLKIKRNIYAKNTIPSCSNFEKKITFQKDHNKMDLMQNIIHFWCPVKWKKSEGMNCTEFSKKKNIFHTSPLRKYLPCLTSISNKKRKKLMWTYSLMIDNIIRNTFLRKVIKLKCSFLIIYSDLLSKVEYLIREIYLNFIISNKNVFASNII